jgi:hypothetical protein
MATILLSAAGAALGSGIGGTVLGLSGAVIGRAVGATIGRVIDQRLLGGGSDAVEMGRMDRFRLMGAGEGAAIPKIWGRARLGGQVIWASRFEEHSETSGGGGGKFSSQPTVTEYSYSVSLAIALCEGEIQRIGRIWADGNEIAERSLNIRVYRGTEEQLPDPTISAVFGAENAPAYRGVAYVVLEDLALAPFGNRVPQFSFEVVRLAQGTRAGLEKGLSQAVRSVAMIPGTGEYALATTKVRYDEGPGVNGIANVHTAAEKSDFRVSLNQLHEEIPHCKSVSLVVSWFGNDLRCASCDLRPKVEQKTSDGISMPWRAGGIGRANAQVVPRVDDRPIYGGTPTDQSVIQAIQVIRGAGQEVMFYPFILMEQLEGNQRRDPWSGEIGQPALPWRGRITLSVAPGRDGTPDRTSAAEGEVDTFFGSARLQDFTVEGDRVDYHGPADWGYRRFILHYAHLCAAAGGVDAFCIGSELRGLTAIRGANDIFPAVAALRNLAAEVRAVLGPLTKISYAADWSEYSGLQVDGNRYFNLDPLWADPNIDFIGIDNYMPLSDWRDEDDHADVGFGSIYNLDYLKANVAGGEGFDWYYESAEGEAAQRRKPIRDEAYGEDWIFRVKDLRNWWLNPHHERIDGQRAFEPTAWVPQSKPFRFTEYGCPAIDKGTNQPNLFLDARSSESALPRASTGCRDDLIQMQYLRAMDEFWAEVGHNPVSELYQDQMVDMERAHVWAWDARPFPAFPTRKKVWSDGGNYAKGHWLNGRATAQPLAAVVGEIAETSGVTAIDTSVLYGLVRGYVVPNVGTARAALQPLMLVHGFDAIERNGTLGFVTRDGRVDQVVAIDNMAVPSDGDGAVEVTRAAEADVTGRVQISYSVSEGDYRVRQAEATLPDDTALGVTQTDLALVLTPTEARAVAERWLIEARIARDTARFSLPRSAMALGAGDVVALNGARYRIDRMEQGTDLSVEAVRIERGVYQPNDAPETTDGTDGPLAPAPVFPLFLDLPLITGDEVPHAPHLAVTASPWPGRIGVWSADLDDDYEFNRMITSSAVVGITETPLFSARSGLWDRGDALRIKVFGGTLSSATSRAVLNGTNFAAIGSGAADDWELFQFQTADLIGEDIYEISLRLRGQCGTDGCMPDVWPIGSYVVLVNAAVKQIALPSATRGLARIYLIGAADRGYGDPDAELRTVAFDGIGLRPYSVVHLRAQSTDGGIEVNWKRRTRLDGDTWASREVPVGEDAEAYLLRVFHLGNLLREVKVTEPRWIYPAALQQLDGNPAQMTFSVAQISDRFGPGPFRSLVVG